MKLAILVGAALLGTAGIAATPAEAQRYGWNDRHDRGGYGYGDRGRRDDRGWNRGYRGGEWNRGYGRGDRGWRGGRGRIVCRLHRGYYGPVRRCFRVDRW